MFETVFGIPAHPLLIHVPIIFVPLLILSVIVYGLVPRFRSRLDWAVVLLAVAAPLSCFFARQSGVAFRARLIREHGVSDPDLAKINVHQGYGTDTLYFACGLGVVALVLVAVQVARARRAAGRGGMDPVVLGLTAVAVVVGAFTGYYVFKTGDTGAHIVWQGR